MAHRRLPDEAWGEFTVRLVAREDGRFDGIAFRQGRNAEAKVRGERDETESEVRARLKQVVLRRHPDWVGYDDAVVFFRRHFPKGFEDERYLEQERSYKWKAKRLLDEAAPLDSAVAGDGFAEAALRAFQRTNLLSRYELMRVADVLKGGRNDAFVRGAAAFASGDMEAGLRRMAAAAKPHDAAKWTALTYLPYLWAPDRHMFLKPEITKLFADRVGHEFAKRYGADLDIEVYQCLLDLVAQTREAIEGLRPRDNVDLQSFVWVVGAYSEP